MSFTFRLCNTLSGNFLRYQNIPDQVIIFCYFKLKFWLKLIHNLSLVLLWIRSILKRNSWDVKNAECLAVCDNLYIIFKLRLKCFQHEKYFSLTKTTSSCVCFFSFTSFQHDLKDNGKDLNSCTKHTWWKYNFTIEICFYEVLSEVTKICHTFANEEKLF